MSWQMALGMTLGKFFFLGGGMSLDMLLDMPLGMIGGISGVLFGHGLRNVLGLHLGCRSSLGSLCKGWATLSCYECL